MKSLRRTVSAVALTTLAASMVACQSSPQLVRPGGVNAPSQVGRLSAPGQETPREAQLNDAIRRGLDHVPGEYLIRTRPGANAEALVAQSGQLRAANLQTKVIASTPISTLAVVKASSNGLSAMSEGQTLAALNADPNILSAEPNYIVQLDNPQGELIGDWDPKKFKDSPNDPQMGKQWHHEKVNSVAGWAKEQGDKDFILAVTDTGVDFKHPDLAAKLMPGYNTVDGNDIVEDGNGHGTHCIGIAAAITNNGVGVAGMAPNVKVLPIQVLSKSGSGSYASVAEGIVQAADRGAKVISMSLGGPSSSAALTDAVNHAINKGALVVVAMGNSAHGSDDAPVARPSYPAATPGVMSVGASDSKDKAARFTQAGKWISVIAPGVDIHATFPTYATGMPGLSYGAISGTSMATPLVAGLAALVWSQNPKMTAQQVRERIESTSDDLGPDGYDILFGHGRVNAARALGASAPANNGAPVNAAAFRR